MDPTQIYKENLDKNPYIDSTNAYVKTNICPINMSGIKMKRDTLRKL